METSLSDVLLFLIDQTAKMSKRHSQKKMEAHGFDLTIDQWVLLKIIETKPGLSQIELAENASRDKASITRSIHLLVKKALVIKKENPNNRRQHYVYLSKAGLDYIQQFMPLVQAERDNSLKGFDQNEIELLKRLLLKMQKNFI